MHSRSGSQKGMGAYLLDSKKHTIVSKVLELILSSTAPPDNILFMVHLVISVSKGLQSYASVL